MLKHPPLIAILFVSFREMDDKVMADIPEEVRWSDRDTFI